MANECQQEWQSRSRLRQGAPKGDGLMLHFARVSHLVACFLVCTSIGFGEQNETGAELFTRGKALLGQADFQAAAQAFRKASQADPQNQEYRRQYSMLRQVMRLRQQIDREQDSDRWWGMARSLRAYYHGHRIYSAALPLDRKIHQRRRTGESAAMLAETQLALGMLSEASTTLRSVTREQATPRTNVLLGIVHARQGRLRDAKAVAQEVMVKESPNPRFLYELACLRALIGDAEGALQALALSFESTPSDQLEDAKTCARTCRDFESLARTPGFAKVLQTQSAVKKAGKGKGKAHGGAGRLVPGGESGESCKNTSEE
jgi:tetratricopeptide (TPR) repeat protein